MQNLRHLKLDFKNFPTMYYMPNSDNRAENDDCLKFVVIYKIQSRATRPRYGSVKRATGPRYGCVKHVTPVVCFTQPYRGMVARD